MKPLHEVKTLSEILDLREALYEERDDFNDVIHTLADCDDLTIQNSNIPLNEGRVKTLKELLTVWAKDSAATLRIVNDKIDRLEKQL